MSKKDTRILHMYYLAEIILFLIIKVGEQVWRVPGQGDPGTPGTPLALLRYSTVICNFLMILYLYLRHGCRLHCHENLIPLAFALTLTADCFMCIFADKRIWGYLFFTLVETVYMIYMKPTWKTVSVRLILYAAMILLIRHAGILKPNHTWEIALALANMVQLTVNLFCAWIWHRKTGIRETLLFALGITFFVGCDYSILVRTFTKTTSPVYTIAAFIVWTCYIPSQILLLRSYVEMISNSAGQHA